jgi:hypothetical protein
MDKDKLVEEWRSVPLSKDYEVSSLGRVRRLGKPLKLQLSHQGRPIVYISYLDAPRRNRAVHSLVMECFVGPRPAGKVIAHKDGDKANNRLSNLRYCTQAENRADDVANGARLVGERHGHAKLDEPTVSRVRQLLADGVPQKKIARAVGVSQPAISYIQHRKTWTHV